MSKAILWISAIAIILIGAIYLLKPAPSPMSESQIAGPSLTFSPNKLSLAPGKQTTIQVSFDPAGLPASALTLSLSFDPSLLKVISLKGDKLFSNVLSATKLGSGTATLSLATPPDSQGVTQAGTVATLVIESLSIAGSTLTFGADTMAVSISQDGNILQNMGQLTIN